MAVLWVLHSYSVVSDLLAAGQFDPISRVRGRSRHVVPGSISTFLQAMSGESVPVQSSSVFGLAED